MCVCMYLGLIWLIEVHLIYDKVSVSRDIIKASKQRVSFFSQVLLKIIIFVLLLFPSPDIILAY